MRIAHLIIAHKNPTQLLRLVKRLQDPHFDIYIHIDRKVNICEFQMLKEIPNVFFIERRVLIRWGGNSTLMAIINSMQEVLGKENRYDFINLLSAQDYPLKSSEEIVEFLKANIRYNFISFDVARQSKWWREAVARFEKYHLTDVPIKGKYFFQSIINRLAPKRKFPGHMELYGSEKSAWWTVSGECAKFVIQEVTGNRRLRSFLRYCWGTDEFVVATIIMNSPFRHYTYNNNLRYIDWSEGNPNPKILTKEDLPNLKNSNMLFARKFDIDVDHTILDEIDQYNQVAN
jgi:hypothetical protein